jgi:hypothetical protein
MQYKIMSFLVQSDQVSGVVSHKKSQASRVRVPFKLSTRLAAVLLSDGNSPLIGPGCDQHTFGQALLFWTASVRVMVRILWTQGLAILAVEATHFGRH